MVRGYPCRQFHRLGALAKRRVLDAQVLVYLHVPPSLPHHPVAAGGARASHDLIIVVAGRDDCIGGREGLATATRAWMMIISFNATRGDVLKTGPRGQAHDRLKSGEGVCISTAAER